MRLPGVIRGLWTPDNAHVLYSPRGSGRLLERDIARGSDRELAHLSNLSKLRALSPDGKVLLYMGGEKLYALRLDGSSAHEPPPVVLPVNCQYVGFSPDGRWIVYSTLVPSVRQREVFVKPFAFAGVAKQISIDGGTAPVWRGDGEEILYCKGSRIFAVRVHAGRDRIWAGAPEPLFEVRIPAGLRGDSVPLAVVGDGSRILFAQAAEGADSQTTYIMSAWDRASDTIVPK